MEFRINKSRGNVKRVGSEVLGFACLIRQVMRNKELDTRQICAAILPNHRLEMIELELLIYE